MTRGGSPRRRLPEPPSPRTHGHRPQKATGKRLSERGGLVSLHTLRLSFLSY